jgi:energy-coupling factor transporter ATP-binding protein EcfA2
MTLKAIKYSETNSNAHKWSTNYFTLNNLSLVTGKNAEGKTKILKFIYEISNLLSGEAPIPEIYGQYELTLSNHQQKIQYSIKFGNKQIIQEKIELDNKTVLIRNLDLAEITDCIDKKSKEKINLDHKTISTMDQKISDLLPILRDIRNWGKSVTYYNFNGEASKRINYDDLVNKNELSPIDIYDNNEKTVKMFQAGQKKFGVVFLKNIKADMKKIGYHLDQISTINIKELFKDVDTKINVEIFFVKEKDIIKPIYEYELSQGMLKSLCLIIELNYFQLEQKSNIILLDDLGQGLDFERTSKLLDIILKITDKHFLQIIITTNERYIMNAIDLKNWLLIKRTKSKCHILNYDNSKSIFDDFIDTGLSNFDFFSSGFYLQK